MNFIPILENELRLQNEEFLYYFPCHLLFQAHCRYCDCLCYTEEITAVIQQFKTMQFPYKKSLLDLTLGNMQLCEIMLG